MAISKEKLRAVGRYFLSRFQEASTWRGVTLLFTVGGAKIEPSKAEAILFLGLAIAGLIAVLFPDKKNVRT